MACDDVYDGRGFAIVRGLDVDQFSTGDMAIIYLGISSYIAERRGKQDHEGSMISITHSDANFNTRSRC